MKTKTSKTSLWVPIASFALGGLIGGLLYLGGAKAGLLAATPLLGLSGLLLYLLCG